MKGKVVHGRRTVQSSVSALAKKRFPVRVQCRSSHRRSGFSQSIHSFKEQRNPHPFVSVPQPVVLHWGTRASVNLELVRGVDKYTQE